VFKLNYFFELKLFFPEEIHSKIVFNSIKPELNKLHQKRSKTKILNNKNTFLLEIKAKDLTALKASVNNYLNQINLINKLIRR
jgi:tRNA threonylcarbamoyladenosine modification (KEOPS) complex  Pcc1 subunit